MSKAPNPTPPDDAVFVCACKKWMRDVCRRESCYKKHDGKRYCVLHYPGTEKKEVFQEALQRKLDAADFDFQGIWFPDDVSFTDITFSAEADFSDAQFSAAAFFYGAQFSKRANFSRAQFNADASFSDAQFNADAYFSRAQFNADADFNDAQFSAEADFNDAQFNAEADFNDAQFSAAASFSRAQFSAEADFGRAQFNKSADFNDAQFSKWANFSRAQLNKSADFSSAVFKATVFFHSTRFIEEDRSGDDSATSDSKAGSAGDAVKTKDEAVEVIFDGANFKDGVSFEENEFAEQLCMSFDAATFEKPERAVFHTMPLRPHWFINIDSRKFTFIDVNWGRLDRRDALSKEIAALERSGYGYLSRLMGITLRQLAVNAEENNRYEEAANFRYMAMEAKRLRDRGGRGSSWDKLTRFLLRGLDWLREQRLWRAISRFNLGWWYWLMSGYGERVARAFVVLLSIWLLFAVIYWSGDATWWQPKQAALRAAQMSAQQQQPSNVAVDGPPTKDAPQAGAVAPSARVGLAAFRLASRAQAGVVPPVSLSLPEAVIYSAYVMSLQKPEPLPANKRAKALVLSETILGPLQAALLALAIRRKFMR